MELNATNFYHGGRIDCSGNLINHKEEPPCIVDTDRNLDLWYLTQHRDIQLGHIYATCGSAFAGELMFRIDGKEYHGGELNFIAHYGGTGYGLFVIDKNYLKQ